MDREQALQQLSLRLARMADGVDEDLDRLLDTIRAAVKNDAGAHKLESLSQELARTLMSSANINIDKAPTVEGGYDLSGLQKLIKTMPVRGDAQQRMAELVRKAAEGQTSIARRKALIELLAASAESLQDVAVRDKSSNSVMGWLGRKSSGSEQDEHYVALFSALLQRLVEHIDVLNGSPMRSHEIRETLEQVLHPLQAKQLFDDVTSEIERIDARIRSERSQTTDFLGDLRNRLDGVEDVIGMLAADGSKSLDRAEELQTSVGDDARSIGEAAQNDGMDELRGMISGGLARITERLAEHVAAERKQFEASQARVEELNERLVSLEDEADALRSELRNKADLALKDSLTGAYNRAGYDERTKELYARFKRSGAALSLVFVDCNKFKLINDNFGHAAGDLVLIKVSDVLHERARASDIVCRYGGDEFVILLPDTHANGAEVFARSACQEILNAGFNDNGKPIDVSISCGVTELLEGDTLDDAIARADEAMYEAKTMTGLRVAVKT